jgi:rifampicin phosphotransferase
MKSCWYDIIVLCDIIVLMAKQTDSPYTIALDSITENDGALVGRKAVGLARLIGLGIPVPDGFCITTRAYQEHLEKCQAQPLIRELPGTDPSSILTRLREIITKTPISDELLAFLKEHFERLGTSAVAVRSSATLEDMTGYSYAGLYETRLGMMELPSCMDNVRNCWASQWSERVFRYHQRQGIDHFSSSMAVIVQRLIFPEASGVIFTGNPSEGDKERLVIEACFGIGEGLVSGKVTPDRFFIRKKNLSILQRIIAQKSLKIEVDATGSLKERILTPKDGGRPTLDDRSIKRLCALALKAGSPSGNGQDIEWALAEGKFFLLQCRPITAAVSSEPGEPPHIWTSANVGEVLPDVVTPMTYSFVSRFIDLLFVENLRRLGIDFGALTLIDVIDGRLYFDMTALSEIVNHMPGFRNIEVGRLLGGHEEKLIRSLLRRIPRGSSRPRIRLLTLILNLPLFLLKMAASSARDAKKMIEKMQETTRVLREKNPSALSEKQLLEVLNDSIDTMINHVPGAMAAVAGGFPGYQSLIRICRIWLDDSDGSIANRLLVGTGEVDSAEPGIALLEIADGARGNPELESLVRSARNFAQIREDIKKVNGGENFLKLWDDFMARHGHHTRGELELYNLCWAETPDYVLSIVNSYLQNNKSGDSLDDYRTRSDESRRLTAECRGRLKNPLKRIVFDYLLSLSKRGLSLREMYKSEAVRQIAALRHVYIALGRILVSRDLLEKPEDIYFLYAEELEALHKGEVTFNVKETIAERRGEYDKNLSVTPHPVVVGTVSNRTYIPYEADDTLDLLTGLAVSPGIAKGPARVFSSKNDNAEIHAGEILVIPFADPGWSPYFITAAGIVMDMGGMLSHGSIIAREYGIPTVVNVGPATKIIRTGQLIEVDGNGGIVRISRQEE